MCKIRTWCFMTSAKLGLRLSVLFIFFLISLVGCTSPSDNFNTNAIYIDATVVAERSGRTTVTVVFTAEGKTVMLVSGDSLTVTAYGETKETRSNSSTISPKYTTTFQRIDASEFIISLSRTGGDASAPSTSATLPDAFDIVSPTNNQTFTQQDTLLLTWTDTSMQTDIAIQGECQRRDNSTPAITRSINFSQTSIGGSTTLNILEQLLGDTMLVASEACTVNVVLATRQDGNVDPIYKGGSITAMQVRRIENVTIIP